MKRVAVIGGQDYYGPTAERDKKVVEKLAELLKESQPDLQIVTGGMPGIPEDFAKASANVLCIVSEEQVAAFESRNTGFPHIVAGKTQLQRRLALTQMENIRCVLSIQGGKYTTHELQLFTERGVPIVTFWGSGGASGGQIPYDNGWILTNKPASDIICSDNPDADVTVIAEALAAEVQKNVFD